MSEPLPPDPYVALGISKTADAQAIKSAYKKLVLRCHPDKFPDESVKQQKQEEFQRIQEAYELLNDDDNRSRYDAQVRLAEMRKEAFERQRKGGDAHAPRPDVRSTGYKVRTAEPSAAFFTAQGSARPATETRPRAHEDTDRYYEEQRSSSRKYEGYESYSHRSPRAEREDRTRTEKKKTRERDERRERSTKYAAYAEDDESDERATYEAAYRRRSHEDRLREEARRKAEEDIRRRAEDARRRAEEQRRDAESKARKSRRDADHEGYDRKLRESLDDARGYIERSKVSAEDIRPQAGRTSSGSYPIRRSRASRERRSSRERERKGSYPEIVEPERRPPPSFEKSHSSPSNIKIPRTSPHRAHTMQTEYEHREPPRLSRADSEPIQKKTSAAPQPSKLRESTVAHDSGYSSPGTPETQYTPQASAKPTATSTKYRYAPASGGVSLATADDHDYGNGHRTILREPGRYRQRSPSPLSREPAHERVPAGVRTVPPPVSSASRYNTIPHAGPTVRVEDERERGRDRSARPLFGEVTDSSHRRGERTYRMADVKFSPQYGKDDIQWSKGYGAGYEAARREFLGGKERWDEGGKPRMERSATFAY
jgi:curved DNA-binding protein CbpA